MLDDEAYGTRNKRGDWKPRKGPELAPLFAWPARPIALAKWLFGWDGYIFPWNFVWGAISVLLWLYLMPSLSTMETFAPGWILWLFGINAVLLTLTVSFFHVPLYVKRRQGTAFKFNARWPSKNDAFLFGDQTIDNVIWSFASGVTIWTAFEAVTFWAYANDVIPYVSFSDHPVYFVALLLAIPLLSELHFYLIHRLVHVRFLYRLAHRIHHNNVNPGPWSGLSMHPIEHLLYFSNVFLFWIIPANPIHAMFMLVRGGLAPSVAHTGFGKIVVQEDKGIDLDYMHYLHHKHFECNYGSDLVPFDQWFDTFHDGSEEAEKRMNERFKRAAAKQGAKNRW
jgi:sterol desaturase/sphingolipid hydroxylase (fatty acid hydroxylase superfamily)